MSKKAAQSPVALEKPVPPEFGPKEAAEALNEHGFLFQQAVRAEVENAAQPQDALRKGWDVIATEYPVNRIQGCEKLRGRGPRASQVDNAECRIENRAS